MRKSGLCHTRGMPALFVLILAVCAYLTATMAIRMWVSYGDDDARRPRYRRIAIVFGVVAVLGHIAIHAIAWRASGGPDMHFFAALSLVTLVMATLTTAAAWRR